jgi:hypothetical protein
MHEAWECVSLNDEAILFTPKEFCTYILGGLTLELNPAKHNY